MSRKKMGNPKEISRNKDSLFYDMLPRIVLGVCIIGFLCFMGRFASAKYQDWEADKQTIIFPDDPVAAPLSTEPPLMQSPALTGEENADLQKDTITTYTYEALEAQIPTAAAYITITDTNISYPIMWSEQEDYYLYRDSNGKSNRNGSIFLSSENAADFSDPINYVFGHNMNSGRMFGQLGKFLSAEYLADHRDCYVVTPDGTRHYTLVYAESIPATTTLTRFNHAYLGTKEYNDYLNQLSEQMQIPLPEDTQLIALITCSKKKSIRTIVYGVLDI